MTTTEPTVHAVQGWQQPPWATEHYTDHNRVVYSRHATVQPTTVDGFGNVDTADVYLVREDQLVTDDGGDISVQVGVVTLWFGDNIEQVPIDQAPVLVAAITELLDALNAESQDGTPTV
jgi:hypothetical protein